MRTTLLTLHAGLQQSPRLRWLAPAEQVSAVELAVLFLAGVGAAVLSAWVKLDLGIPGHNILRVVLPMALGLALVPRKGAASVMGLSALAAAIGLAATGAPALGTGAMTSLLVTGFFMDLALIGARPGRSVYLRLILAGVAANLAAMAMRGGMKLIAGGNVDGLPIALWLPRAAVTYPLCGAAAGLIAAVVWFRFASRKPEAAGGASP